MGLSRAEPRNARRVITGREPSSSRHRSQEEGSRVRAPRGRRRAERKDSGSHVEITWFSGSLYWQTSAGGGARADVGEVVFSPQTTTKK